MSRMGGAGDLNLRFEPSSGTLPDLHGHWASGAVVMAATVDVPGVGPMPALVFRFANPDGSGFYPPTILVCEDEHLAGLPELVTKAVAAALDVTKAQR